MQTYRLYVNQPLIKNNTIVLSDTDFHYIKNVIRLKENDIINVFNAKDGEFKAKLNNITKTSVKIIPLEKLDKEHGVKKNIAVLFAPLKSNNNELVIEKLTELGVNIVNPILTQHTVVRKVNLNRLQLIAKQATEQCQRLDIPKILEAEDLYIALQKYPDYGVIFCNEHEEKTSIKDAINSIKNENLLLLFGPEGGFSKQEVDGILNLKNVTSVSLGKNILRAETSIILATGFVCISLS
jgi:16S rRNA (uracil1498-N3)-methyltransferase